MLLCISGGPEASRMVFVTRRVSCNHAQAAAQAVTSGITGLCSFVPSCSRICTAVAWSIPADNSCEVRRALTPGSVADA